MHNRICWEKVLLRDICQKVQYGYTASADKSPIGPKFLRITDIVAETVDWNKVPYCSIDPKKKNKYSLHDGDIVIARTGATTGYAKYIKNAPDSVFASYLVRLCLGEDVESRFVGYVVESDDYKKFIQTNIGGSAQPNANAKVLTSYPLTIPPLPTQRKIASILSAYDDLIENNLRRIKILEEMAQNLYREWFVKFRFPGYENVRFVDSPLGRIPEGWEVLQLGDVADQIRKNIKPENVESGLPYIGLEHIPRRSITFTEWDVSDEVQSSKLLFKERDILFGKIRPYFHKIAVAPFDGICSTDTIVIRPKSFEMYFIVLGTTSSVEFIDHATVTSQGSKMPRANWSILAKYPVYMPTLEIMNQFNDFVGDIVKKLQTLLFTNLNLRQTRDLLLPKLISGEVDVSELNIETLQETPS